MEKKRILQLLRSILWFVIAACWLVILCMDFYHKYDVWVPVIHALIALIAALRAVFHLAAYIRGNH